MAHREGNKKTCTTCPYCGVGCGVIVQQDDTDTVSVTGDVTHPANLGKLCSKGLTLGETLGAEDRLLYPIINGAPASWEAALSAVASKFSAVIHEHGPDAVALYLSGQLLTEDYYIANKLMKGYIGSANIDTNSRLCMASSVAGHKRAFGADIVPGCYEDLEAADLIILTGSNLAWCHPILYQRIASAKAARPEMKIVVIDPRETASCDIADLHLAIAPGSDVPLFQGLFKYLDIGGFHNQEFIQSHTQNYETTIRAAIQFDLEKVASSTRLSKQDIEIFYELFAQTDKTVTLYSQGVNQARDGTDKVNAIINCHLLTGRIGKIGAGPFSVTGQPNAMGGREVGGLANQLASHMDIENPEHRDLVQRYWDSPTIANKQGLKAVDLFEAIHAGEVKAVWIMATNPVDSMPDANRVKAALDLCELVIVSDIYGHTDTVACADIVLPSTGWGEKEGAVTNSERRISRQRRFLTPLGDAKDDWWQLCEVAKRMGYKTGFEFRKPAEIFREYAGLCAFENDGSRDLDLSGLQDVSDGDYDVLDPIQWPVSKSSPKGLKRFFESGQYFTDNGKAKFVVPALKDQNKMDPNFPYVLNTGRIRDQWHSMTRTGRAQRLSQHISEPFVEIHPSDGDILGLKDADIAELTTPRGIMMARVVLTKRQMKGSVFVPMHFTDHYASQGRVDVLTAPIVDPVSGQPALKSSAVAVKKYDARWFGFAVIKSDEFESVRPPSHAHYWTKSRIKNGVKLELAGCETPDSWEEFTRGLLPKFQKNHKLPSIEVIEFSNAKDAKLSLAFFRDNNLIALLYVDKCPVTLSREWACEQLGQPPALKDRQYLLAGRPAANQPDKGAIICSCMGVGLNDIQGAIRNGCHTVKSVGEATSAGTNCGSCQPELRAILKEALHGQAA